MSHQIDDKEKMNDLRSRLRRIKHKKNFFVALIGGIGSGKSSILFGLKELGVETVNTDQISRKLLSTGGQAVDLIEKKFGTAVINKDRSVNRKKLGAIVFKNPTSLSQLENIIHPLIWNEVVSVVEELIATEPPYIAIEIPVPKNKELLSDFFDLIVFISCDEGIRKKRVLARDGIAEAYVDLIIKNQTSNLDYEVLADIVLDNSSNNLIELNEKVHELNNKVKQMK